MRYGLAAMMGCLAIGLTAAPAMAQSDFAHHQAMVDIAATPPWDYGGDDYDDGPSFDFSHWRDWSTAPPIQPTAEEVENLARYRAYMDGQWFHGAFDDGACASTFLRKTSGAMVVAFDDWALLGVFGPDAPRPVQLQTIPVTLKQDTDAPATVNAFSLALPWDSKHTGLVVFAVPSVNALIDTMGDVQTFDVSIKGKPAARVEWTGGHAARDALKRCIDAR